MSAHKNMRDAERLARQIGLEEAKVHMRRRGHPVLRGRWRGREVSATISLTPSCKFWLEHCRQDMQRQMRQIDLDVQAGTRAI